MRATTDSIKDESDVLRNDLKLMDASYHGLQQRYYKLRTVGENMRSNEQQMKKACDNYERRFSHEQERYKLLKSTARNQLNLYVVFERHFPSIRFFQSHRTSDNGRIKWRVDAKGYGTASTKERDNEAVDAIGAEDDGKFRARHDL